MNLEFNHKKICEDYKCMEVKLHATKTEPGNQRRNFKNIWKHMKMKTPQSKTLGYSKSSPKREICSNTGLRQEAKEISNKQPNLTPKGARKEEQTKSKTSRRKEIVKIRGEKKNSKIEGKKTNKKTDKLKQKLVLK